MPELEATWGKCRIWRLLDLHTPVSSSVCITLPIYIDSEWRYHEHSQLGSHFETLKQETIQQYMTRSLNRTSSTATEPEPETADDEDEYEDGGSLEEFKAWLDAPAGSPFPGPRTRDLHPAPAATASIVQACSKCKKSPCNWNAIGHICF